MDTWLELLKEQLGQEHFDKALKEQDEGKDAATYLLHNRLADKKAILRAMSDYYKVPYLELEYYHPDNDVVLKISEETARRLSALPLFEFQEHIYIALTEPDNLRTQDYLNQLTGSTVDPVIVLQSDLEASINRAYLTQEQAAQKMEHFEIPKEEKPEIDIQLRIEDEEAPAIKLVNYIFSQAINLNSSDIHLEAFPARLMLRYRVDGVLHEFPPPPLQLYRSIVSRIKILSNLDVTERRLPQDGRASFSVNNREYDLRVSVLPNLHGEGVVIRILDKQGGGKELSDLGFSSSMLEHYKAIIKRPHGILIVTGPTGSGKSTTLYGTLKYIFTPRKKIITLEDPVEYQLEGVTQVQINSEIGFTFASGLRSILRHDPDIIMLGEIRDLETAQIAIRSSLTGHGVLSTLHTNDSPSSITRLIDMGVEPFLVMSSLNGIIAQRLVRRLCPACKVQINPSREQMISLGISSIPDGAVFYEPRGCGQCGNLGYKGRVAIYELLEVTEKMKRLKAHEITPEIIKDIAREKNFRSLRESAFDKALEGITSIEEVLSVT